MIIQWASSQLLDIYKTNLKVTAGDSHHCLSKEGSMIGVVPISGPISHLPSAGRVFRAAHSLPGPHQHPLTSCGFARVVAHRGIVLVRADKEPKVSRANDVRRQIIEKEGVLMSDLGEL